MRRQSAATTLFWPVLFLAVGFLIQVVQQPPQASGLLRVTVLDIGQGDAILIDTPENQHILIDGGSSGEALWPALEQHLSAPKQLRLVIASHDHADHIGGLIGAVRELPTEEVWISGAIHTSNTYRQWLESIRDSSARVATVYRGHELILDEVAVKVLHPPRDMTGANPENDHEATVVVKVSMGRVSFLLTGDLDEPQELELVGDVAAELRSSVLKVTHHGSRHGSSAAFLAAVQPSVAVISVGENNKYEHPHPETLMRLGEGGIAFFRTDQDGAVTFTTDGLRLWAKTERQPVAEIQLQTLFSPTP